MEDSRQKIKLRESSTIFPPQLDSDHSFLQEQPLHRIIIRHPHNNDVLLTLFAWDHASGALHHGLVHDICAIIADNRQDGYLSTSREPNKENAKTDHTDLLPAGLADYYFHVPALDDYPVVPSFDDWKFPGSIPEVWQPSESATAAPGLAKTPSNFDSRVRSRDKSCRLTSHTSATEVAHLCPGHAEDWFIRNEMWVWNQNQNLNNTNRTRDPANCVLLRSDLHKTFDDRIWVFYPKERDTFVAHFLQTAPDQAALYHNVATHSLQCEPRFLYARFAWAILPSLGGYLSGSKPRRVKIWNETDADWKEEVLHGEKLRERVSGSRSRSPRKRARRPEQSDAETQVSEETTQSSRLSTRDQSSVIDNLPEASLTSSAENHDANVLERHDSRSYDEDLELEQDMLTLQRTLPNIETMTESQKPKTWYPGWRAIARMKNQWLDRDRERSCDSMYNNKLHSKSPARLDHPELALVGATSWHAGTTDTRNGIDSLETQCELEMDEDKRPHVY